VGSGRWAIETAWRKANSEQSTANVQYPNRRNGEVFLCKRIGEDKKVFLQKRTGNMAKFSKLLSRNQANKIGGLK
jgi:hypothetical protein